MSRKVPVRVLDICRLPSSCKTKEMPHYKSCNQRLDQDQDMFSFMEDDSEDFYTGANIPTLMPSEDIWKKFGLLPTPPRSPKHESDCYLEFSDLADFLLNDDTLKLPNSPFPETPPPNGGSLCSKLIQDCMWSGSHTLPGSSPSDKFQNSTLHCDNTDSSHTADCVDPAAVFPYPISDTTIHSLGTETPSDSEEEIDVVTTSDDSNSLLIPRPSPSKRSSARTFTIKTESVKEEPRPVELVIDCAQGTGHHNYSLAHSYSYKRTRSSPNSHFPKRIKRELDLKSVCKRLETDSSRENSDSEDLCDHVGKRSQHNVLERKRRNDLKYSFFVLRDTVPELSDRDKAPKVLILKKAADHILELRNQESKLFKELDAIKKLNENLRRTLSGLKC